MKYGMVPMLNIKSKSDLEPSYNLQIERVGYDNIFNKVNMKYKYIYQ